MRTLSVALWVGHSIMYIITISILGEAMSAEEDQMKKIIGKLMIMGDKGTIKQYFV